MTNEAGRAEIISKVEELLNLLEDFDVRISCCNRCGEHPVLFTHAYLEGDHPHITICPDETEIWIEPWDDEEEEEEDWDQYRNDRQKSE